MYQLQKLDLLRRSWILNSNVPARFIGTEFSDLDVNGGKVVPAVESWIQKVLEGKVILTTGGLGVTGVGLLFDGEGGIGKTTYSCTILTDLIRRLPEDNEQTRKLLGYKREDFDSSVRPVYFLTIPDLLYRKKALMEADSESKIDLKLEMDGFYGRSVMDHLNVRVLVIDDLGKEQKTEYSVASVDEIVRARYDKALPTIVTTNVVREKMASKYGDAMGSFVFEAFNRVKLGTINWRADK